MIEEAKARQAREDRARLEEMKRAVARHDRLEDRIDRKIGRRQDAVGLLNMFGPMSLIDLIQNHPELFELWADIYGPTWINGVTISDPRSHDWK